MKVTLEPKYKSLYTIELLEAAKLVITSEKEDEETAKGWAAYAVTEALKGTYEATDRIIEATARTARNYRIWNAYGENTLDIDVWIEATAKTTTGFIEVGAYLSDIWQSGAEEYKSHMYYQYYGKEAI